MTWNSDEIFWGWRLVFVRKYFLLPARPTTIWVRKFCKRLLIYFLHSFVAVSVIFLKINLVTHIWAPWFFHCWPGQVCCATAPGSAPIFNVLSHPHHSRIRGHWKTPGIHTQTSETGRWSCETGAGLLCNFPCRKILNKMQQGESWIKKD